MTGFTTLIEGLSKTLNEFTWSPFMLVAFLSIGGLFTLGTGFYQLRKFREWFSFTFISLFRSKKTRSSSDKKALSQFGTFATAIASTVGTGNIAGVSTAIVLGGPGAVFWMWVSAFLGMMTNFAENVLGVRYRYKTERGEWMGGAFVYMERGLGIKKVANVYAFFSIIAAFGTGNAIQSNSIADAMNHSFGILPYITGTVLAVVGGAIVLGGMHTVAAANEKIVPIMIFGYLFGGMFCILSNLTAVPDAVMMILREAFCVKSAAGGVVGYGITRAMRLGIARGVFTNEAGTGTSALANSVSDINEPVIQGMWGIFQVFADTIVVCSITALTILTSDVYSVHGYASGELTATGVALASNAFKSSLGSFGGIFVSLSILFFAFSTIISWSFFGAKSVEYLFGRKAILTYKLIFIGFITVGAMAKLELVWELSETLNGLMGIPNIIALILLSPKVFEELRRFRRKNRL